MKSKAQIRGLVSSFEVLPPEVEVRGLPGDGRLIAYTITGYLRVSEGDNPPFLKGDEITFVLDQPIRSE